MITRRSFFTGLAVALVAPAFVRRALAYYGWGKPYVAGVDFGSSNSTVVWKTVHDPIYGLLHFRINEAYRFMRRNLAEELYGDSSRVLVERPDGVWRYITLRESLLERSERHFQRAAYWRIQGKPEYAMGSLHKAAVAEDQARSLPA